VVLYDRRADEFYRSGPSASPGLDEQLHEAALVGTSYADRERHRIVTAIRLGSDPIAALALEGRELPDSVLQGVANLVAIGLERAHAHELSAQIEAARQSEKVRTILLDELAQEFKTPLTSVLAATTAVLENSGRVSDSGMELVRIADEEAHRLQELVDDTVDMGRLDSGDIRVHTEMTNIGDVVRDVVDSMQSGGEKRPVEVVCDPCPPPIAVDRRLVRLALRQLLDNALKYSPPRAPVQVRVHNGAGGVSVDVTDHGQGIPDTEQRRVFERLYRSPSVKRRIPGAGLGLNIALNIARAHHGDLSVTSTPGETTFRLTLPDSPAGAGK
jgi:two-component system, OmpR family, sensor histidine kinase KdpD